MLNRVPTRRILKLELTHRIYTNDYDQQDQIQDQVDYSKDDDQQGRYFD